MTKRRWACAALALTILLTLSACALPKGEDLLSPPKLPVEYDGLYEMIGQTLASGALYAPPARGENRQNIHLVDLDNDGRSEALVFLNFPSEPLLRVHVYAKNEEERYTQVAEIPVTGDSIDSVTYADLNGNGFLDIIVGYRLGLITGVSVYSYAGQVAEIYTGECSLYTISDMDGDGINNLLLISLYPEQATGSVRLLRYEGGEHTLTAQSSAPLSSGISVPDRVTAGRLSDGTNALLVTSALEGSSTATLTDIFICKDQALVNITLDPDTGASDGTLCLQSVYPSDIDGDPAGVIDVPYSVRLPPFPPADETADPLYIVQWYSYDSQGRRALTVTTYHTRLAGWYWVIPGEWKAEITVNLRDSRPLERVTTMALYNGPGETPDTLVTFYTITRAVGETVELDGRVLLHDGADTVVAAEIAPGRENFVDESVLRENFHLKPSEWQIGVSS